MPWICSQVCKVCISILDRLEILKMAASIPFGKAPRFHWTSFLDILPWIWICHHMALDDYDDLHSGPVSCLFLVGDYDVSLRRVAFGTWEPARPSVRPRVEEPPRAMSPGWKFS